MDLSVNIGIGSSIQIGAFVLPICAIIGWGLGLTYILVYNVYTIIALLISTILLFVCLVFGEIVWYTGTVLVLLYALWAV